MKKAIFQAIIAMMTLLCVRTFAQVGIGPTEFTPNASAGLHVSYTNKGILFPQVDLNLYLTPVAANAHGLTVYNTNAALPGGEGLFVNFSHTTIPDWRKLGTLLGSGSANQVTFWSGTSNLGGCYAMYWDNATGRLGIGTSSPQDMLHITDNLRMGYNSVLVKGNFRFMHTTGGGAFLGYSAGNLTLTGTNDFGFGTSALAALTTGTDNIAIGYNALLSNSTTNHNIAIGSSALTVLSSGVGSNFTNNIAIGGFSGYNLNPTTSTNGRNNVMVGYNTLFSTATGASNVAVGSNALFYYNSDKNIAIGALADISSASVSNSIAIGYNAIAANSNEIRLGTNLYTRLFCEAVKNNTTAGIPNIYINPSTGQILQSTASVATGTGIANKLVFWTGTNTQSNNSLLHWDDDFSQLGVGTASPITNARLTVDANTFYAGYFTSTYQSNSTHVVHSEYTGGQADAMSVFGRSASVDYYGYGGYFVGGYTGVYANVTPTGNHIYYGAFFSASGGSGINYGVYSTVGGSGTNYAGYFGGNVTVSGSLSKGGGSFKIDHPLDPENKYLYHSFVESPDMKNVYDGVVVLDGNGSAVVELPAYFEALNRDFRYQLTAIGAPGPDLYIAEKVNGNQFRISGGQPGMEVSWQVTGIRQDAWAEKNRIPVEVEKTGEERGKYLYPEALGKPRETGIDYTREQEMKRKSGKND